MTWGALTFLNPWLLAALATLPVIYWLLRTVPPRPRQIEFPPTRILKDVENREKTPAKTPWWLLLIRLLAAALIIGALAEPILNPSKSDDLSGTGPLAILVDNGWASAHRWDQRADKVDALISTAENQSRPVIVFGTATREKAVRAKIESTIDARSTARGITPLPFAPDLQAAVTALQNVISESSAGNSGSTSVVWLTDGIDHTKSSAKPIEELAKIADGATFAVIADTDERSEPLALAAKLTEGGQLNAIVKRTHGTARTGTVTAFSSRGENLGGASFDLATGATETSVPFNIPLELRNQVSRIAIDAVRSAGAVNLLDARSRWRRVALFSSEGAESAQPLLAPLYYLNKAMKPYAQLIEPTGANLLDNLDNAVNQNAGVMMMADIGTLSDAATETVEQWVKKGGILVRFAGPRMEKATDSLVPVRLRIGGRTLGGALSWSTPQPLAQFEDSSPFAGLEVSPEITVARQVLADPSALGPKTEIWARLQDGTPLVTATRHGDGELVLFHVTANSDWSNLPISGLFVDMLKRVLARGSAGGTPLQDPQANTSSATQTQNSNTQNSALLPIQTLDGLGVLQAPPPNAEAIPTVSFEKTIASAKHPPGYYGAGPSPRALNIAKEDTKLAPLPALPAGTKLLTYSTQESTPLKPWLLAAALALILLDILAVLFLQGLGSTLAGTSRNTAQRASIIAIFVFASTLVLPSFGPTFAFAQSPPSDRALDKNAKQATANVTLGYVLTNDASTDETSRAGLSGLGRALSRRTSVTPGEPIGVNIATDEIAFYPILYWPVVGDPDTLSEESLAKIDAYMKRGGLIIFDTKDFGTGQANSFSFGREKQTPLQKLLAKLDIPRLEPVPPGHVLTKSFYLLYEFPGRWAGGQLWVEAGYGNPQSDGDPDGRSSRRTRTDGVTSIMITSNDFAAAWALDDRGRPLFPTVSSDVRQREMAFRTGINIVMHALTGNYKADQVHVPSLLQRLGQ